MAKRSKENIDPDLDDSKVKKKKLAPNNRFKVLSRQEEINLITKGYVLINTHKSTVWSMNVTGYRSLEALRTYENISLEQHRNVSNLLMTNNTSSSVEADVSSHDELSTGFLAGINGCSIGTVTVVFSDSF